MTVSSAVNRVNYTGNGVTTVFAFNYIFYDNADLKVYLDSVLQSSGYTVAGAGTASGTVTFSVAPIASTSILIKRTVDLTQETDFSNFDGNPSDVTEKQFDLNVMMVQELSDGVDRSLKLREDDPTTSIELPLVADRANKFLAFDSVGDPVASAGATVVGGTMGATGADLSATATPAAARTVLELGALSTLNTVAAAQIASNAVTTVKILDDNVTYAKIAAASLATLANFLAGTASKLVDAATLRTTYATASLQRVKTKTVATFTSAVTIPHDNTKPQNTEGVEIVTVSITPKSATSVLKISYKIGSISSSTLDNITCAVFVDTTADALDDSVVCMYQANAGYVTPLYNEFYLTSGSTSARTYKLRVGGSAGTVRVNLGSSGTAVYNGTMATEIIIEELQE